VGLYSQYVFPRLLERSMARPSIVEQRRHVIGQAQGSVLEIGFGTGLNLPFYTEHVDRLVTIDPNPGMTRWTRDRIAAAKVPIEQHRLDAAGQLPFDAGSFDTVVSTWTMCSIRNVSAALAEAHRVLKPGGHLLFIEHGLAPEHAVARWQRRLTPVFKLVGDGCHLDRNIDAIVRTSPLHVELIASFYLPDTPKVGGYTYRGVARK
jgi:ubiquinone/menaquinone biosynthesis C-methylase UbiE